MLSHKNYLAHDESGGCILGDIVRIQACRPLSKKKHFSVAEVMKKARTYTDPETGKILQ
jgi:small subunit ribosomal protein S17